MIVTSKQISFVMDKTTRAAQKHVIALGKTLTKQYDERLLIFKVPVGDCFGKTSCADEEVLFRIQTFSTQWIILKFPPKIKH